MLHRDQKFRFHRPILVDDRLYFDTYLDSVIESHGTVIAEIRSEVTDAEGKPVVTSIVTMFGEAAHRTRAPKKPSPQLHPYLLESRVDSMTSQGGYGWHPAEATGRSSPIRITTNRTSFSSCGWTRR